MSPRFSHRLAAGALAALLLGLLAHSHAEARPLTERRAAPPRSRFATLEGIRVHYRDAGRRGEEALVFVHGWTCDLSFWRMQAPAFAGRTRVIAVDLPGHGRSDKPEGVAYTMDLFARAVEAVLRDAGVRRAVLVGHSMGMPVARQFYRRHPERTLALVSVDGALRPMFPRAAMEQFIAPLRGPGYREAAARVVDGMLRPIESAGLRAEIRAAMLSAPQHVAVGAMEGMADDSIWAGDQIRVPVLAVLARSPFWPADNEALLRRIAPDLEYRMWDGVSHFLMMDRAEEFNRTLANFLAARKLLGRK